MSFLCYLLEGFTIIISFIWMQVFILIFTVLYLTGRKTGWFTFRERLGFLIPLLLFVSAWALL